MEEGDLGFGQGLKPGAISAGDTNIPPLQRMLSVEYDHSSPRRSRHGSDKSRPPSEQKSPDGSPHRRLKRSNSLGSVLQLEKHKEEHEEHIPSFAGVPMGTSLRQQRELFHRNMKEFLQKKDLLYPTPDIKGSAIPASFFAVQQSIVSRLHAASDEVLVLQSELEACHSQLDSKYRAIRILQGQFAHVAALNAEKQKNIDSIQNQAKDLQKEVNALQFELDAKSSSYMFSEQTWAQRFDRLSLENTALMATLQARSDEVRRLHSEKMGLKRERDELLALMDANERLQYDRHWTPKNDTSMKKSFPEQLALLGSCLCRGSNPEPCQCAKAAAVLKKDNSMVRDEQHRLKEQLEEAYLVADAFRKAFEEQLNRNADMGKQLADSSSSSSSSSSPSSDTAQRDGEKNGMKRRPFSFLKKKEAKNGHSQPESIGQLLVETMGLQALKVSELDEVRHDDQRSRSVGVQVSQPMPDLIRNMAELLNDKSEALAHQRLVTKMLARRTQDLEATMKKYGNA